MALWDEFGSHLGIALRSVVYAYDPEAIILGGAISKAYGYFEKQMRVSLSNIHFPKSSR
ncbi:MAG: ROK family protein [Cytophagales bacterium]|nr:ROK family protein [Cytophagales bacterium]